VPLIGVGWYNARYLGPATKAAEVRIETERKTYEDQRAKTLSEARKIGVTISALRALADTFQVRFAKVDALIDSVTVLRNADQTEVTKLEGELDSLRTVYSIASGKSSELSALLPPMQARIDSLKTRIASREDSIRKLEAEKQADQKRAKEVLDPNTLRKNSALLEGKGNFPNRDALPRR
jgi:chromosome segregation ATPase